MTIVIFKNLRIFRRHGGYILLFFALAIDIARKYALFHKYPGAVVGVDPVYHLSLIQGLISGNSSHLLSSGYPPFFHYLISFFAPLFHNNIVAIANFFIYFFSIAIVVSIFFIIKHLFETTFAGLAAILLVISYPFVYRTAGLLPENLAFIFLFHWIFVSLVFSINWKKFLLLTLLSAAILYTNSLTSTQLLVLNSFLIVYFLLNGKIKHALLYFFVIIFSLIIALPFLLSSDTFWIYYAVVGGLLVAAVYGVFWSIKTFQSSRRTSLGIKATVISFAVIVVAYLLYDGSLSSFVWEQMKLRSYWPLFSFSDFSGVIKSLYRHRFLANAEYVLGIHPIIWFGAIFGIFSGWFKAQKEIQWVSASLTLLGILSFSIVVFGGFWGINPNIDTDRMMFFLLLPVLYGVMTLLKKISQPILRIGLIVTIFITSLPFAVTAQLHDAPSMYQDINDLLLRISFTADQNKQRVMIDSSTRTWLLITKTDLPELISIDQEEWGSKSKKQQLQWLRDSSISLFIETNRLSPNDQLKESFFQIQKTKHYTLWEVP